MNAVSSSTNDVVHHSQADQIPEVVAENIRQALRGLQFGEITISVRNGTVIQIDRVARMRQFKSTGSE